MGCVLLRRRHYFCTERIFTDSESGDVWGDHCQRSLSLKDKGNLCECGSYSVLELYEIGYDKSLK